MVTKKTDESIQSKGGKARAAMMTPEERRALAREAAEARWAAREGPAKDGVPRATHMGMLRIGTIEIPCAVLDDGRRVLTQRGFLKAIGRSEQARGMDDDRADRLPPFLASNSLKSFINAELAAATRPIVFRMPGKRGTNRAYGYAAELLPRVCRVYLDARDAGVLPPNQQHIAKTCDLLVRGLATVGIVALVDEATGYQRERERDELHRILELYIAKELLPWTRRFPDEFYKEMFRLRGWRIFDHNAAQGPRFAGKLTNQLVYERLPPGVLNELRRKNPVVKNRRRHAHHQFLTESIGNPHLERHIASVTTLMRAARTWGEFEAMANRALPPRTLPAPEADPQLRMQALGDGGDE
jgi:hypothetical protein